MNSLTNKSQRPRTPLSTLRAVTFADKRKKDSKEFARKPVDLEDEK